MKPVLEMRHVEKHFGGVRAIDDFSVTVGEGIVHGLIGPNGAGKTTIFNTVTGLYKPSAGSIHFYDRDITATTPHEAAALGIGRTFQNIRLFANMSVLQNVVMASSMDAQYTLPEALLRLPRYRAREKEIRDKALSLLETVGLQDRANERANCLPYGHQRKLEIARAMALNPKLLLLDEPAAGMNADESQDLVSFIQQIKKRFGITVLMIEHHMDVVTNLCDTVTVLNFGKIISEGTPTQVKNDRAVIDAYLGGGTMMLKIENLKAAYGGIEALKGISIEADEGEIVAVLGANGAGKSTLLKCISSVMKPTAGTIRFMDAPLPSRPYDVVNTGIVHVPEGRQIFAKLTVMENLRVGCSLRNDTAQIKQDFERVFAMFPRLKERETQYGGLLSGGEQQMLAVARGIMARPRLMMLDEPSLGLAPIIVSQIFDIIKEINQQGTSVILVEQNANKALEICNRAYILSVGKVQASGTREQLLSDDTPQQGISGRMKREARTGKEAATWPFIWE